MEPIESQYFEKSEIVMTVNRCRPCLQTGMQEEEAIGTWTDRAVGGAERDRSFPPLLLGMTLMKEFLTVYGTWQYELTLTRRLRVGI